MPTVHNALTGSELHDPLGTSSVGALDLPSSGTFIINDSGSNEIFKIVESSDAVYISGSAFDAVPRYLVLGRGQSTKDRGVYFFHGTSGLNNLGAGLIYNDAQGRFQLLSFSGTTYPTDTDSSWDDADGGANYNGEIDLELRRLKMTDGTNPGTGLGKWLYSDSDDKLQYQNGTFLSEQIGWRYTTTTVGASTTTEILEVPVSTNRIGQIEFKVIATVTAALGSWAGTLHYYRDGGGMAWINNTHWAGGGSNTTLAAAVDNTNFEIELELTNSSASTVDVHVFYRVLEFDR